MRLPVFTAVKGSSPRPAVPQVTSPVDYDAHDRLRWSATHRQRRPSSFSTPFNHGYFLPDEHTLRQSSTPGPW